MELLFDEDLVEGAVLDCARRENPLLVRRFHREREKIYGIANPDERNAAFFRLHLDWFREWGLESFLRDRIAPFANLQSSLKALAFRKARNKSEEGAELYVNREGARHGMLALRPERFSDRRSLVPFLNHELMHLNDMVDPGFCYDPDIGGSAQPASQLRLIRERYRLLWDITIDGRLVLANRETVANHEQRWSEFNRAFSFLPEPKRQETFQALWNSRPQHADLAVLAKDPRGLYMQHIPQPGGPCPLCGFPTFEWASQASIGSSADAIRAEFPDWTVDYGACKRCVEVYESTATTGAYGAFL